MTPLTEARLKPRFRQRCLGAVLLASFCLLLSLTGIAWYSTAKLEPAQAGAHGSSDRRMPVAPTTTFAPVVHIVPSQDGTALFISAGGVGEPGGTVFANVGIGPGADKDSWTMTYSNTVQSYVTTATGFTPGMNTSGSMNITTTLGLDTEDVGYTRAHVLPPTPEEPEDVFVEDLKLSLVSTDTIATEAYIAAVRSYAPPGSAPLGHRLVGSAYSARASGALPATDKPMMLRLSYHDATLAGADPHTLAIFAWDANPSNKHWDKLGGQLFYDQRYVSVATSRFTTYALMATPAWHDDFVDFNGLNFAEISNVTLGLQGGYADLLVLSYMATSGTAVSKPITPTTAITSWGTLTFTRTVDPPTTTLTVDVLSLDGTELLTNVTSGTGLAGIDPAQYPSLKLRANLSSMVAGETPALDEWRLTWQPKVCYGDIQDVANHWHGLLPYAPYYDVVLDGLINILDIMTVAARLDEGCGGAPPAP